MVGNLMQGERRGLSGPFNVLLRSPEMGDAAQKLGDVNQFLQPLTGFRTKAVSGFVPGLVFFRCLLNREFPTTVTIRRHDHLDYLPEPDIFHDVAGHVPMHTDSAFAETLVRFGQCAETAAELVADLKDEQTKLRTLTSMIRVLGRLFWFTIEFGLIRSPNGTRVYGSGLLSSHREIEHAIEDPQVQRYPIQLEWAINQTFKIDCLQPLLFIIDSFDHLYSLINHLESWLKEGKLSNVAGGYPEVDEKDIRSFLQH